MAFDDDLNKPLGKQHQKPKSGSSALSSNKVLIGVLVVCLSAVGIAAMLTLADRDEPSTKLALEQPTKVPPDLLRSSTEKNDENKIERKIDPNAAPLEELKPIGTITEPKVRRPEPSQETVDARRKQVLAHQPDPQLSEQGATGVIPKISPNGLRAMDIYAREAETAGNFGVARVVLIIGGLGISQTSTQQAIRNLPPEVVLAFAPYGNSLKRWMREAREAGHELLLQIPMEPFGYPENNPGKQTLTTEASFEENQVNLHWLLSRITNYVGVMNYLGGKMLGDATSLSPILSELAQRGLLFVDDGSVKNSNAGSVAKQSLLPFTRATVQIDNFRSRAAIGKKLNFLAAEAKRSGIAIGVGNAFPETIGMVAEFIRQAKEQGIEITPVSAAVKYKK